MSEYDTSPADRAGVRSSSADLAAAYEGLEADFAGDVARNDYRAAMLRRSTEQADFLAGRLPGGTALEIGTGNGRLLIELARRGALIAATGVDIAGSRIRFARRWAADLDLPLLRFEVADALEMELVPAAWDVVVCITGAFAYFDALGAGTAESALRRWEQTLRPGGLLVLELYPHPDLVRILEASGGHVRTWQELDPPDPWRFYLSDLRLQDAILVHDKTFIHRDDGRVDAGRAERLALYSEAALVRLVHQAGFVDARCFQGWTETAYRGGESLVLTARRAGGPT